ncbi:molybdopterin-dependent oxidoreductase [Vibrio sp. SS-MA-C1-2]|uniref:molybdopterin cofactor-binding domain-containing protein n=1 Tax=Vibrio sp. SS-MA-C1-2 TaxID=2908646 RepID=UPI001F2AE3E2|nr:molybdopterin cofactor-binding domain-containing protein [Vibrio sp. SS-MA-C1-2]UJF17686.1 molybdopterin-dependent oxidoreductase [Vibrio sp. SS-MA-C1-2]
MNKFEQLAKPVARVDGLAKVKGSAIYGNDINMPGMLYGVCRYTDIVAGKVVNIDTEAAKAVDGVVRIATYQDIPGDPNVGVMIRDYLPLVNDEVVFSGDVLAIVAAETYEAACRAADLIDVEYEAKQPVSDPVAALDPSCRCVHSEKENNIVAKHHTVKGDIDAGFAQSKHVIERRFEVGFQEHAYIEPESVTAYPDPTSGALIVAGSIQNPHKVRGFIASYLDLPQANINVKRSVMGGSFGGKDDTIDHLACRTALMASLTKRPVKFTYTREQSIIESPKRHPYIMDYKVGFDDDGSITAMKINIIADSGAYAAATPFVTWRSSVQAAGPYEIENVRIDITGVYTNNSYTSAMRGFGSPQIVYANESLMDEIAEYVNISAFDVRQRNVLKQDSTSITGQVFNKHTVSADEVMQKAIDASNYIERRREYEAFNKQKNPIKKGIGLALSYRGCSLGAEGVDTSSALVCVNPDGSINVSTGVCENGQGLQTTMALITAETLGVDLSSVIFTEPETSMITDGGPTVASRGTITGGNAVKNAAEIVKKRIFSVISSIVAADKLEDTVWKEGMIFNANDSTKSISFADAADKTKWAGVNLAAYGWFDQPEISWNEEEGNGSPYFTWVYGCQVVDLTLDSSTGKVTVDDITAVHDVGQVINPVGFEGQVSGGIAQGIGMGILEDYNIAHGEVKSENFDSYLLPTIKDVPPINVIAVENPDPGGPFGAKSIGEPATELVAAAINNAVGFATNTRHRQLPLTLEQVTLGYNLKKPARQSEILASTGDKKQVHRLNQLSIQNPASLTEALTLLAEGKGKLIAGGTDVLVQGRLENKPQSLINIAGMKELTQITETAEAIIIGSGVVFNKLTDHPSIQECFPLLATACHTVGSNQIRNRATVGGNIVNAAPCADSVPPLVIYGSEVELTRFNLSTQAIESRWLALDDFIIGGYRTLLQQDEILTAVKISKGMPTHVQQRYSQLGRRNALNITRQSLTATIGVNKQGIVDYCRLVDGALFSKPQRLHIIEEILLDQPLNQQTMAIAVSGLSDMIEEAIGGRWSAPYKKPVFINMFNDLLNEFIQE